MDFIFSPHFDDSVRGNIGDTLANSLHFCYRSSISAINQIAEEVGEKPEKIIAYFITNVLSEGYMIFPKILSELPDNEKQVEVSRFRSYSGIDNRNYKIFISYRRKGSLDIEGRIFDNLIESFGEGAIFKDVNSMPIGTNFRSELRQIIPRCELFILLIGPDWLKIEGGSMFPRLFDLDDPVRIEIETAINAEIPVIPILLPGAIKPNESQIPNTIQELCNASFLNVGGDPHFQENMENLIDYCRNILNKDTKLVSLPIPRLDRDSLTSIHVLAAIGQHVRDILNNVIKEKTFLSEYLKEDSNYDLMVNLENIIVGWRKYLGMNEESEFEAEGQVASLTATINKLLQYIYGGGIADDDWENLIDDIKSRTGSNENISKEEYVAAALTTIVFNEFSFIPRTQTNRISLEMSFKLLSTYKEYKVEQTQHKVYISYKSSSRNIFLQRILDTIGRLLAKNSFFTESSKREGDKTDIENKLLKCKVFLLFIDSEFERNSDLFNKNDRLRLELEIALKTGVRIIPLLLPGGDIPRTSQLPESLQPILSYTFSQVRADPDYIDDMDRIISYCRESITTNDNQVKLATPYKLPIYADSSIRALVGATSNLLDYIIPFATNDISLDDLDSERKSTLIGSDSVIDIWGQYFALTDKVNLFKLSRTLGWKDDS